MAKDYAKFVPPKQRSAKRKSARPGLIFALLFLLLSSVGMGYYLFEKTTSLPDVQLNTLITKVSSVFSHHKNILNKKNPVVAQNDQPPSVRFDFYNQLPQLQVNTDEMEALAQKKPISSSPAPQIENVAPAQVVAKAEVNPVPHIVNNSALNPDAVSNLLEAETKPQQIIKTTNQQFIIQLGTFKTEQAAKRLVYELASVGFVAQVVKAYESNHKIFRVQQGPFNSVAVAKSSQQLLQKRGILGDIHKLT